MDLLTELAILVLAAFVGFEVISKVPNTLHTPLMSGTNAIHGIVLLGGLLILASAAGGLNKVLLVIAIMFGTINIVGGFLVTDQMVALFNGVGGGAVALIAWVEYRRHFPEGGELWAAKAQIPSLFAAIIGSISFWGSNIAFGKLQEILPGRPIRLPGQQVVNGILLLIAVGSAIVLASGTHSELLFILGILVCSAV